MKNLIFKFGLSALTVAFMNVSCTKTPHVDATSNELDNLSIVHTNINGENNTFEYNYVCTADTNQLSIGGPLLSGSALVKIRTINDSVIFEKNITTITAVDQPIWSNAGIWKVEIDFKSATGTFAMTLNPEK